MSTDTENNTKNQDINPDKNQTSDFNDDDEDSIETMEQRSTWQMYLHC